MTHSRITTSLAVLVAMTACSKHDDNKPTPAAKHAEAMPEPPKPPAASKPWTVDAAAVQAKLQGAWVLKNESYLGARQAWEVKGDQVKVWDHGKEQTYTLTVDAPCQYELTQKHEGGSSGSTGHFALDGDTLRIGLGDSAVKQGSKVIGCVSAGIYVLDGTTCKSYHVWSADNITSEDATCSMDGTTFKVKDNGTEYTVETHGNVFVSDQLWNNAPPLKVASYDEAKTKADAMK